MSAQTIRCAACPLDVDTVHIGIFTPRRGCRGVGYVLCSRCAARLAANDPHVLDVLNRVVTAVLNRSAA